MFKDDRKQAYLNPEGADRPLKSPIPARVLDSARRYRLGRLRSKMAEHDCSALLLYDPVNIRYAFDSSNMSIWTMHNAARYALILADGPAILFEFEGAEHLNQGLPGIDEIRPAKSWIFFTAGDLVETRLSEWADEVSDIVKTQGRNRRLAVDKLEPAGAFALQERGLELVDGQELAERARSIKSPDEIELMRWTIRVCEAGNVCTRCRSRVAPNEKSGQNCIMRTRAVAVNGLKRNFLPQAPEPIPGTRSVLTM
ncbi:Proline dipeptidase (plasmid) [Sinorhizobium fredii CCBAU 25509]|nr:Proline dipeptidase [Sinorhizobium fredii CCBAU 25509]